MTSSVAAAVALEAHAADDHDRQAVGLARRTRSAAAAISSASATWVERSAAPERSRLPRRSRSGASPATPIATSVVPRRNGRPKESVTIDGDLDARARRRARARIRAGARVGVERQQDRPSPARRSSGRPPPRRRRSRAGSRRSRARRGSARRGRVSRRITSSWRRSLPGPASSRARARRLDPVEARRRGPRPWRRPSGRRRRRRRRAARPRAAMSAPRSSPARISGSPSTGRTEITRAARPVTEIPACAR